MGEWYNTNMAKNQVELASKKCVPCEGGMPPLTRRQADTFLSFLHSGIEKEWQLAGDAKSISREYAMKDFKEAVAFVNSIASVAEAEGHHPDLHLTGYRKLRVDLATHAAGGLTENDFILAAKIDRLPKELKKQP